MSTPIVTVYTRNHPKCMACEATKRRLNRRGIAFSEVDIDDDPNISEALTYLGLASLPVVLAETSTGERCWSGFRPDKIDALAVSA
ncbi:glutaredoxin domain-containing protein [Mycobacterium marinum]|uniref:glutaredoxin domain-containing protein n=1 Tax=Mycobacterium marinum TaxID=1781 RepID=UPI0035691FA9